MNDHRLSLALVQMTSNHDVMSNKRKMLDAIEEAKDNHAQLICFPENALCLQDDHAPVSQSFCLQDDIFAEFAALSAKYQLHIHLGSFPECIPQKPDKVFNTSLMIHPEGLGLAYRKIHLFSLYDEEKVIHDERLRVEPGEDFVQSQVDDFVATQSICYDLRFPELYREQISCADIIFAPSAFTPQTGAAHWEVLLRARAIENQCYVIAAAQTGQHSPTRTTYGHSSVVSPWGEQLLCLEEGEKIGYAELKKSEIKAARTKVPALSDKKLPFF